MTAGVRADTAAAALPPRNLPGLDPSWSRIVDVPGAELDAGLTRQWHCVDTADALARLGAPVTGTILAVHGNPTWSYLWRRLAAESLRAAEAGEQAWRVVAVDQLEMGCSERTGRHRPLPQRVADLSALTDALALEGPVVTLGHDWGGVISLGWAIDHPERLAAVALLNTAVHHPAGTPIPAPLRLAGARGVLAASTVATPAFLDTTLALASPPLAPEVKAAFRAPYRAADRRAGIGGFVADIPVDSSHESFAELERIAAGVAGLTVPALMLWGPNDPVFGDRYLDDLIDRLPHADVHRFEGAGHLIAEDRPYAPALLDWLARSRDASSLRDGAPRPAAARTPQVARPQAARPQAARPQVEERAPQAHASRDQAREPFTPLWRALEARAADDATAVIDMATRGRAPRRVSWRQLDARVRDIAAGLTRMGVRRGDRVSLLVPPGPTLTAVLYACLRIGAVVVVADAGLGVKGLTRAVRGSWPDVVIGGRPGLAAARALGWPGIRISAERLPRAAELALGVSCSIRDVADLGAGAELPPEPGPGDDAAILFTSGSTGPAKGVVYTHGQLAALRDVLGEHLGIAPDTGLVTGFAPFALLGPALGTLSATPDMDVSAPRTLTATAVAAAVTASGAGIVFLSPAAILNVVDTADALTHDDRAALARVHTFLSTGAPIGAPMLRAVARLMPNATPHTPYGMTECLLVADITLEGVTAAAAAPDTGVCVGTPIGQNRVLVSALDADGRATGAPSDEPGVLGEIVISAPHLKSHYDRLHLTDVAATRGTPRGRGPGRTPALGSRQRPERASALSSTARWHRTGDIGHLDRAGRLWIEGRIQHVIVAASGPLAPVGPEQQVESADAVRRAAVVGVGPHGLRQAVAVVEAIPAARRPGLADPALTAAVRATTELPLAAVLVVPQLPTDVRHNSKIDRSRLSDWAERTLAGEKPGKP
ncbi:alpha/beta fold hydrolase [Agrococcus baldri]|uniref:Acyl-CoA synthetase n=1 Tax=Agrococcus baldri TaxID=153730 RepID=A0AA87UQU0_9MICO|nr:alpha/beta fold hydrolase [Agrococcus baldri]GEK79048.1 acyl-CoA synthetase [Agrococcus baldri]